MIKDLYIGISRHFKRFFLAIFFAYTTIWAFLEPLMSILDLKTNSFSWYWFSAYLLVSIIIATFLVKPKQSVKFNLINTNTKVIIEFGDLFKSEGHKVIPVNEYFDSLIGKPVSPKSVHGIFIEKILGGYKQILDDAVNNQLAGKEIDIVNRPEGKKNKYPIGTTITLKHNESIYFLFSLCNSDNDCKVTCTPSLMLKALEGLWKKLELKEMVLILIYL